MYLLRTRVALYRVWVQRPIHYPVNRPGKEKVSHMAKGAPHMPPRVELTDRERDVAKLLCASNPPLTMQQMSVRLGVELTTLKGYLSRMMNKFNVGNSRQLTVLLLQNELQNSQVVVMRRAGDDGISSTLVKKSPPELAAEQLYVDGIAYVSPADAPAVVARFLNYDITSYTMSSSSSSSSLSVIRLRSAPEPN
jgi:DNA-binding CsgD family transcriptional regulator